MRKLFRAMAALLIGTSVLFAGGCGGGGGGGDGPAAAGSAATAPDGGSASRDTPFTPAIEGKWQLFALDRNHQAIAMFDDANLQPGAFVSPGAALFVELAVGLAYDSRRDILYVGRNTAGPASSGGFARFGPGEILVFTGASSLGSQSAPVRTISLGSDFFDPLVLQIDAARDELYVAVNELHPRGELHANSQVQIFANASQAAGAVAPARVIPTEFRLTGMAVDFSRSAMYTLENDGVRRWKDVHTADPKPDGRIFIREARPFGVAIDAARDRLYVANGGSVEVVEAASTATASNGAITLSNRLVSFRAAFYDAGRDRLYISGLDQVFIVERASQLAPGAAATALAVALPLFADIRALVFP